MKTFSNKIHKSLKENKSISLKILLEETKRKKVMMLQKKVQKIKVQEAVTYLVILL